MKSRTMSMNSLIYKTLYYIDKFAHDEHELANCREARLGGILLHNAGLEENFSFTPTGCGIIIAQPNHLNFVFYLTRALLSI